ncbi:MAG TPA: aldo/keto reductase, partial [Aggregatilineales bacterium]|nr:aldo/keto reductase [Aggregatilineales bacterium]
SGKFRRGMSVENLPQDTRIADSVNQTISERWDVYNTERTWTIIENLLEVAEKCGKEPSQVALNWVKDRPGVTAPIIGVRTMQHLESNLGAVGWTMDAELRQQLDDITAINAPYPHDFVGRNAVARARK